MSLSISYYDGVVHEIASHDTKLWSVQNHGGGLIVLCLGQNDQQLTVYMAPGEGVKLLAELAQKIAEPTGGES